MTLKAMREKRAGNISAMRAILDKAKAENRETLTAEETAEYDRLKAEADDLKVNIDRVLGLEAMEAEGDERVPAAASRQGSESPDRVHAQGDPANREFESLGQFLAAVRFNPGDSRLQFDENAGANATTLGSMNERGEFTAEQRMDTGSAGGFLVPTQLRSEILRIDPATSIVRPRAQVIPAGSPPDAAISFPALDQGGEAPENMFGGVEVQWIAEGQTKPETEAKFREIKLEPKEVAGIVYVTDKLLRNWQAAGSFLEGLLRGAVTQAEDFAFIAGNGIGKPLGFLNSGALLGVNRATANTVKYVDLVGMLSVMLMRGGSPVWVASQSVLPQILNMVDGDGRLIYQTNLREGVGQTLLGYPIVWNNRSSGLGTKGDISLVDFANYLIKDGSGPFVATSEHVRFAQNQTAIKIFWNVDGQPWLTAPFKEENGYEVSPFVTLDVPA